jgi:hypothetical protein
MRDMKTFNQILLMSVVATSLVACGKQSNPDPNALALAQNGSYVNGQWVGGVGGQGGCIPLNTGGYNPVNLSFSGTGVYETNAVILAGLLPANSTAPGAHGTITMGGGMNNGGGMIQYSPKVSTSGMLQISSSTQGGSISGTIQLNPAIAQQIVSYYGGGMNTGYNTGGYNTGYNNTNTGLCVQSVALDIVQNVILSTGYNTGYSQGGYGQVIQALVYLTLSNGQTTPPIVFQ